MTTERRTRDDYTVGWICPLEVEQIAALLMLDEEHPRLPQSPTDHNVYNLGSIAGHNVVVAGLHQPGNSPAATVVTQMRMSFPNMKFGLLVGIGGAVPIKTDNGMIRLGDVVVSKPTGVHSGAVQYDHGKAKVGYFERTGSLTPPPAVLLNAAQDLAAKRARSRQDPIEDNIQRIDTSIRGLRRYRHPSTAQDHLYQPGYIYKEATLPCDQAGCDPLQRVSRIPDEEDETYVVVHRGTVASGELVVKDAILRDTLANEFGLLCFETEAAGVLADFPCLIIRGISDYCDSHKNDIWQGYAAATAAAYTRQLFFHMPVDEVKRCITYRAELDIKAVRNWQDEKQNEEILNWLTSIDYGPQHSDYLKKRQPGTGQWLLDHEIYQKWLQKPGQRLFCPGIPGAGKTILTSVVVDDLNSRFWTVPVTAVAYIYYNFNRTAEQRLQDSLSSLLKQLSRRNPSLPSIVKDLHERHSRDRTRPTLDEISRALQIVAALYTRVFVVIDALDECQTLDNCRGRFLSELFHLQAKADINVFATSRHIPDIETEFLGSSMIEICASKDDIRRYLESHVSGLPKFVADRSDMREDITEKITQAANGMFLLAQLYHDSLMDKDTPKALRIALQNLATGSRSYDTAYENAMERIEGQLSGQAKRAKQVLAWITCANRPLTTTELQHALAVESGEAEVDEENIPLITDVVSVCAGLVTVDEESNVIRLVHYTTQDYFQETQGRWFPAAHFDIATICITYLSFSAFANGCCQTDEEFRERLGRYHLYDYAARHWGYHARVASVYQEVLTFLQKAAHIEASIQALFAAKRKGGTVYSRRTPRQIAATHVAAIFGFKEVMSAVWNKENIDGRDSDGRTPLSWAAKKGHESVVRLLLDKNAQVDAMDNHGLTPLSLAAKNGHESVVRLLLDKNAQVDAVDTYRQTPLSLAAKNGHESVVRLLLDKNAQVDAVDTYRQTPLIWAAGNRQESVVRLLLDKNAQVDAVDDQGLTPLSWAAGHGLESVVRLLLDKNAQVDAVDIFYGLTPLSRAAWQGHESVVRLLLDKNAQVDARDSHRKTPLSWAAKNGHESVVRLLLDKNAQVDAVDSSGQTPLWWAVWQGHKSMVRLLLDKNAHVDAVNSYGQTPLSWAAEKGYESVVRLLLDKNAQVDAVDSYGQTPLLWAAKNGHEIVVRLLLDKNAQVDAVDSHGQTPLSRAAENGHESVVRLLLDKNAQVDAKETSY